MTPEFIPALRLPLLPQIHKHSCLRATSRTLPTRTPDLVKDPPNSPCLSSPCIVPPSHGKAHSSPAAPAPGLAKQWIARAGHSAERLSLREHIYLRLNLLPSPSVSSLLFRLRFLQESLTGPAGCQRCPQPWSLLPSGSFLQSTSIRDIPLLTALQPLHGAPSSFPPLQ